MCIVSKNTSILLGQDSKIYNCIVVLSHGSKISKTGKISKISHGSKREYSRSTKREHNYSHCHSIEFLSLEFLKNKSHRVQNKNCFKAGSLGSNPAGHMVWDPPFKGGTTPQLEYIHFMPHFPCSQFPGPIGDPLLT